MSRGWQPIETAPKDGTRIICFGLKDMDMHDGGWCVLRWKTNHRIVDAQKVPNCQEEYKALAQSYFGDPQEYDDYDLAIPGNGPTHWHPIEEVPVLSS